MIRFIFIDPYMVSSPILTKDDVKRSFIVSYLESITPTQLSLKITAITSHNIQLKEIRIDSLVLPINDHIPGLLSQSPHFKTIQLSASLPPSMITAIQSNTQHIQIVYETPLNKSHEVIVNPYPYIDESLSLIWKNYQQKSTVMMFSFLKKTSKGILCPKGQWVIDQPLILDKDQPLYIQPGTHLQFKKKGMIKTTSSIHALGKKNAPISITGQDSGSIIILSSPEPSEFNHVLFKDLHHLDNDLVSLPGAISIYESLVTFNHCIFEQNQSGDDMLNIVRSKFEINHSIFRNIYADALDSDFSTGTINHSQFQFIGNDAIDTSGSLIDIQHVFCQNIEDKAVSAGEKSTISINTITITDSELALISKDLSLIKGDRINISRSNVAFIAFQKKPEYGPGNMDLKKVSLSNVNKHFLLEKGSTISIDNTKQKASIKNVKKLLYGTRYGKSSSPTP